MLRIEAFGELTVVRDDRRVEIAPLEGPHPRGMLTLLACHGAAGISRERARALLQPDDAAGERDWWESMVRTLREWLGERHLVIAPNHLALKPPAATSDVVEFSDALAAGALERAVQLHRGRLVEGLHHREAPAFERWLQLKREALASEAASALERLAEEASRRGEPLTAVRWWRQLARDYPLNHRIAASLMEALVQAGDREGALRHARFLEALADERLALPGDEQVLAMAHALRGDAGRSRDAGAPERGGSSHPSHHADSLAPFRAAVSDRYRIDGEVGRGGHGSVLRATDLRHQRQVAVKVLHPELSPAVGATRFAREIRLVAALHHPHILPLYDSGSVAGTLFFVMPLVKGQSLRERLQREGPLPVGEALAIARQVASALGEAHRNGVVHRDIKPENILLTGRAAMVADFGIACAVGGQTEAGLTAPGMVVGTPAYMSPEQGAPEEGVDGRADVYSLGCVLYEMLSGTPPFGTDGGQALLARHASGPVPTLAALRPDLPRAMDAVLHRALAKRPDDRFDSADVMEEALAAIVVTSAEHVAPPGLPRPGALTLAVAAAVLLALLVLLPLGRAAAPAATPAATPATDASNPPAAAPSAAGTPPRLDAPSSTSSTTHVPEMRP